VIFVDTNVLVYAVGRDHPLREEARAFLENSVAAKEALVTSAEVLQELLHIYLPVHRDQTLDAALELVEALIPVVWSIEAEDVKLARTLAGNHSGLKARDLLHLACCQRREVSRIKTFDRGLASAF
jgi:predicted nucleic acid-binding protein